MLVFTTSLLITGCSLATVIVRWALQEDQVDPFAI